ncbi:unnamed protein product, partial [Vitis vinifera]
MMVEWILINTCNLSNTEGGFPPYGYSGYSAPSYGYGLANNGMGYGGYGGKGYGKWSFWKRGPIKHKRSHVDCR